MTEGLEVEFNDKNKYIGILIAVMAAVRRMAPHGRTL
jgi:hypothetical protein